MPRSRRHRPAIPLMERFAVGREEAASLFSISAALFDALVAEEVLPRPSTYLHSLPRWDVRRLWVAWQKLIGDDDEGSDPWSSAAL